MQFHEMSLSQLYSSPNGRITRSTLWLKYWLPIMLLSLITAVVDYATGMYSEEFRVGLTGGIAILVVMYPSIMVMVKRAHDRNHSGLFVLLLCVPVLNIWPIVDLHFLRGTVGDNQYGADPTGSQ